MAKSYWQYSNLSGVTTGGSATCRRRRDEYSSPALRLKTLSGHCLNSTAHRAHLCFRLPRVCSNNSPINTTTCERVTTHLFLDEVERLFTVHVVVRPAHSFVIRIVARVVAKFLLSLLRAKFIRWIKYCNLLNLCQWRNNSSQASSCNIIQTIKWTSHQLFSNHSDCCTALRGGGNSRNYGTTPTKRCTKRGMSSGVFVGVTSKACFHTLRRDCDSTSFWR